MLSQRRFLCCPQRGGFSTLFIFTLSEFTEALTWFTRAGAERGVDAESGPMSQLSSPAGMWGCVDAESGPMSQLPSPAGVCGCVDAEAGPTFQLPSPAGMCGCVDVWMQKPAPHPSSHHQHRCLG